MLAIASDRCDKDMIQCLLSWGADASDTEVTARSLVLQCFKANFWLNDSGLCL